MLKCPAFSCIMQSGRHPSICCMLGLSSGADLHDFDSVSYHSVVVIMIGFCALYIVSAFGLVTVAEQTIKLVVSIVIALSVC